MNQRIKLIVLLTLAVVDRQTMCMGALKVKQDLIAKEQAAKPSPDRTCPCCGQTLPPGAPEPKPPHHHHHPHHDHPHHKHPHHDHPHHKHPHHDHPHHHPPHHDHPHHDHPHHDHPHHPRHKRPGDQQDPHRHHHPRRCRCCGQELPAGWRRKHHCHPPSPEGTPSCGENNK